MLTLSLDTSQERLKACAALMLILGLFVGDSGTAVAALALVASTGAANRELLQLSILFIPAAVAADLLWLLSEHHRFLTWLASVGLLLVKAGVGYFAWDLYQSLEGGASGSGEYQPFGGGAPVRDPFSNRFQPQSSGYAPPPMQQTAGHQPTPLPQTLPVSPPPPAAAAPAPQQQQPGDLL